MHVGVVVTGSLAILVLFVIIPTTAHANIFDDTGIMLGQSCLTMIKNNVTSDCPTYETLNAVFPDTSDNRISGEFIFVDGLFQRGKTLNDHSEFYRYETDKKRNWIDPPADIRGKLRMIIIEPSLPEYKIKGNQLFYNGTNGGSAEMVVGHSRYTNPNCSQSTVTAENWLFVLGDTMRYMGKNCDEEFTYLETIKTRILERTEFDIRDSYKWKLSQWVQESKERCKGLCFEY